MLRVALVNMPFSSLRFLSFALSQLAAVTRQEFGDAVAVDVVYGNHELAQVIGVETYDEITHDARHQPTGLGEWLFRPVAFPELEPNKDAYFARYYRSDADRTFRTRMANLQRELPRFCDSLAGTHLLASADVVGFTTMFAQTVPSLALARVIKERNPSALTVLGGANCETPMGAELAGLATMIDFVFSGPALWTFVNFLRRFLDGDTEGCDSLVGVVSRRNRANPRYSDSIGPQRSIDEIIEPHFDEFIAAFDSTFKETSEEPTLFFETSRGCWWGEKAHCTFCGLNGASMAYRAMDADLATRQFQRLFHRYYPWCKTYFCVDNIMPANYPRDVLTRVTAPPGATIFYEVKASLTADELRAMAAAGVTLLQPGIEALATATLKLMKKGTSSFQNIEFLKNCVAIGIHPLWNLLIGFPGEDEATYEKYLCDLPLLHHLPPPLGVFPIRFDRFSPYFRDAPDYGLDLRPFDHYALTFPAEGVSLSDLAYYFVDENDADHKRAAARWRPPLAGAIAEWQARWIRPDSPAELRMGRSDEEGSWEVIDTRGDTRRTYWLDEPTRRLLRDLRKPTRLAALIAGERGHDACDLLDVLRDYGLIFEDGGRGLSLVVQGDDQELRDLAEPMRCPVRERVHA